MSFKVPRPFLSDHGKPSIELDDKACLFARVVNHIGRQWPEHEVIGHPYAFNVYAWNRYTATERQRMLDALSAKLFDLATEDRLTVLGMGPVLLLPIGNAIPADQDLRHLLKVTQDTQFPVIADDPAAGVRVLYQRAHVITPLTTGA